MTAPVIEVRLRFLSTQEGGRMTPVTLRGGLYCPHLRVAGGEYLGVRIIEGPADPVAPGDSAEAAASLAYFPSVSYAELKEGASFEMLEGAQVVAVGQVLRGASGNAL